MEILHISSRYDEALQLLDAVAKQMVVSPSGENRLEKTDSNYVVDPKDLST